MSFYNLQTEEQRNKYKEYLQIIGSLSNLFSDSQVPYLYYRIAEKMFCKAFNANDLSRGDVSYDAQKNSLGIGLKTFLRGNDKSIQKIAEFNKDRLLYEGLSDRKKIIQISKLRNARLDFTNNLYNIENSIYHCVVRDENKFYIHEEDTKKIDIASIQNIQSKKSSIYFNDDNYEYSFSLSKSTLMKRFKTNSFVDSFDVDILKDPLEELYSLINDSNDFMISSKIQDTIYLPLYGQNKKVYNNSGLNQWNANGRKRNPNEVYIPIPSKFYKYKPTFFPNKDVQFALKLPNGKILNTKICQSNNKALMSNPNEALGQWILRDIFKLDEGTLVTNDILKLYGIDSVRIDKINELEYEINFAELNSHEEFMLKLEQAEGN